VQQSLFQDGYKVLQVDTDKIGRSRLKRFLKWLDKTGRQWTEPDLAAYGKYLREERHAHASTVYQNMQGLRAHYITILSNPENYAHVPEPERPEFVNRILSALGYNTISVNYKELLRNSDEGVGSENMQILLPPNAYRYRDTQITAFINWLDQTDRRWTQPDLLEYKEHLIEDTDMTADAINNAVNAIRRRYAETLEGTNALEMLSDDEREMFLENRRRLLGYYDEFPSRSNPVRDMLEDDPYNRSYLTPEQEQQLLSKPDITTFTGMRDRALLALCVATGIQQFEVCVVTVDHLHQTYNGEPALFVPESKQRNERLVPYEEYVWVLDWLDEWLKLAGLTESFVFRGTYGNRDVLRPHGIAPETASDILSRYPLPLYGTEVPMLFGDLRATCARRWYDAGLELDEIERRLGTNYRRATLKLLGLQVRKAFRA
jgi:site-specific recombinase XerC